MKDNWEKLIEILTDINSKEDMESILNFLLTIEEKSQLSSRVTLTKLMCFTDLTQREIAKNLGVSISTVTRCSNALKSIPERTKNKFQ